jgi:hypothetical protein
MTQVFSHHPRATVARALATGALLAAALLGGGAEAQQSGPVTLVFDNGLDGENLSGTLMEFDGTRFMLETAIGPLAIPADGVSCIGAACPEGTELELEESTVIVLTTLDGQSKISGNLLSMQDDSYVLATDVGEITVPADAVSCEGALCAAPRQAQVAAEFGGPATLHGSGMSIEGTLVAIEGDTYVLDVPGFGELRVGTAQYRCEGPGCP